MPTQVGSGLTRKHYARLERPNRDKHSSLFDPFVKYDSKKLLTLALGHKLWRQLTKNDEDNIFYFWDEKKKD